MDTFNKHENLPLLAIERTGWRRWVFGRWVYKSEPFRRDLQRKYSVGGLTIPLKPWERLYPDEDKPQN